MNINYLYSQEFNLLQQLRSEVTVSIELITPEMAQDFIDKSEQLFTNLKGKCQRKSRKKVIDGYSDEMLDGKWKFNAETIKFDKEGRLMDGYHRMKAVVKSGQAQIFLVVRGIDNSVMDTIDVGHTKTAQEMLEIFNKCTENGAAAVIKARMQLQNHSTSFGQSNANIGLTHQRICEEYSMNEDLYVDAVKYGADIQKDSRKFLNKTEVGAIYLHLVYDLGYNEGYVTEFFDRLATHRPTEKSIYRTTEDKLIANAKMGGSRTKIIMACWNAMVQGHKKMTTIDDKDKTTWFYNPKDYVRN